MSCEKNQPSAPAFLFRRGALGLLFFLLGQAFLHAADFKISAVLDPAEIVQGQDSFLRVSVAGASKAKVTIPTVEGLQFVSVGQSTQIQFVNLTRSDTVTFTYQVSSFKPGNFTIPPITVEADGLVKKSQELALNVLKGSNPEPAVPNVSGQGREEKIRIEPDQGNQPYFLQLEMKEEKLYVGQIVPVAVRLFVRADVNFASKAVPVVVSDAFTLGPFNTRPDQYMVEINGVAYRLNIFSTKLTAIKSGDYSVELKQDSEVVDRQNVLGGGSSLFDQFMAPATVRQVELHSKPVKVSVLPLPQENKPASFSGAIGSFTFVAQPSSLDLMAGEPLELNVAIEGSGNFDRIDWKGMAQNRLWRSYPPTSDFRATDASGVEGKKSYKQALIPLSSEIKEIPMQEFSYFDPALGQYKTLRSDPIALHVKASVTSPDAATGQAAPAPGPSFNPDALNLLPNRLAPGSAGSSLKSRISQSWFPFAAILPLLLLAGAVSYSSYPYLKQRLGGGGRGRELDRALALEVQAMQSALQQSDPDLFARSARHVLQQSLARDWNCPPESVTRHEVRQRQPRGVEELEALFAGLDAVDYSGAALSTEEMQRIYDEVSSWLQSRKGAARV